MHNLTEAMQPSPTAPTLSPMQRMPSEIRLAIVAAIENPTQRRQGIAALGATSFDHLCLVERDLPHITMRKLTRHLLHGSPTPPDPSPRLWAPRRLAQAIERAGSLDACVGPSPTVSCELVPATLSTGPSTTLRLERRVDTLLQQVWPLLDGLAHVALRLDRPPARGRRPRGVQLFCRELFDAPTVLLSELAKKPRRALRSLTVQGTTPVPQPVLEDALVHLPALETLAWALPLRGLAPLRLWPPPLASLDLGGCDLDDATLALWAPHWPSTLKTLRLGGAKLTEPPRLCHLTQLQTLALPDLGSDRARSDFLAYLPQGLVALHFDSGPPVRSLSAALAEASCRLGLQALHLPKGSAGPTTAVGRLRLPRGCSGYVALHLPQMPALTHVFLHAKSAQSAARSNSPTRNELAIFWRRSHVLQLTHGEVPEHEPTWVFVGPCGTIDSAWPKERATRRPLRVLVTTPQRIRLQWLFRFSGRSP